MRKIPLSSPKDVVIVEKVTINVDAIQLNSVVDDCQSVVANITYGDNNLGSQAQLTLWWGQDYVNIGQWTDDNVTARILELIS